MSLKQEVRDFIFKHLRDHPHDVVRMIVERFEVSRQTANSYLRSLVDEGLVYGEGKTKARRYFLKDFVNKAFDIPVTPDLMEDTVWLETVQKYLRDYPKNVVSICHHGFTEIVNNVIDHSESPKIDIEVIVNALQIEMVIRDHGIGIFEKIQNDLRLDNKWYAILELSKGKLTTDAEKHTGEGIFFTSRMFDEFSIWSDDLFFRTSADNQDWIFEIEEKDLVLKGTCVSLFLDPRTTRTAREVFNRYEDEDSRFSKTHVPVRLAKFEGEDLVSRSQAKRLVTRFEKFTEIVLDFRGVSIIGQAFADELFRVFQNAHPGIHMIYVNANQDVERVIKHVRLTGQVGQQLSLLDEP